MRIHGDYMTVQTKQNREFINITQNVKFAVEKSGIRDGVVLVSVLHSNAAVFLNDDDPGLFQDLEAWLAQLAPPRTTTNTAPSTSQTPPSNSRASSSRTTSPSASPTASWSSAPGKASFTPSSTAIAPSASCSRSSVSEPSSPRNSQAGACVREGAVPRRRRSQRLPREAGS